MAGSTRGDTKATCKSAREIWLEAIARSKLAHFTQTLDFAESRSVLLSLGSLPRQVHELHSCSIPNQADPPAQPQCRAHLEHPVAVRPGSSLPEDLRQ